MFRKYDAIKNCRRRYALHENAYCGRRCEACGENSRNGPVNINKFYPTFNPSITINVSPGSTPAPHIGLETAQYVTVAQTNKASYTNQDALAEYGSSNILDPHHVSYTNLFVNGVLQPPAVYEVEEGALHLNSSDLPPNGAPIILLFLTVVNTNY